MEDSGKNLFIAERAYTNLYNLSNIGIKLSGTDKNEVEAVNFILSELAKIKEDLQSDIFDIEIDHSLTSGTFITKSHLRHLLRIFKVIRILPSNCLPRTVPVRLTCSLTVTSTLRPAQVPVMLDL